MENNKYNKFYSTKSTTELLESLREHRQSRTGIMDSKWYDALLLHFKDRELTNEETSELEYLLSEEFTKKTSNEWSEYERKNLQLKEEQSKNFELSPEHIEEAGRELRAIAIISFLSIGIGVSVFFVQEPNTQKLLAFIIAFFSLINLGKLYSAGNLLIKSVKKKKGSS
jgi:hypothetical protein